MNNKIYIFLTLFTLTDFFGFGQSCAFTGNTGNEWNNASNWSCGIVPDFSIDSIIIPEGKTVTLENTLNFSMGDVLLVSGSINGNAKGLFFNNNSRAEFSNNAEVHDVSRIKMGGSNEMLVLGNASISLDSISFFNNVLFTINSTECLEVGNFFEKGGSATVDGSGCIKFNGTESNFKNFANGSIFGCVDPEPGASGILSRESCGSSFVLEARDVVECLGTGGTVVSQLKQYIFVDGELIRVPDIESISIVDQPESGMAEVGNGSSFKITYTVNNLSSVDLNFTDTIRYRVNALGTFDEGLIIIKEGFQRELLTPNTICKDDVLLNLSDVFGITSSGSWKVNSSLMISNFISKDDLVEGVNQVSFENVTDEGCVNQYRGEMIYAEPDASFSLPSLTYCEGSSLELNQLSVTETGGKWLLNSVPVFETNSFLQFQNPGTVNLAHTVEENGCNSTNNVSITVIPQSGINYDPFSSTICKYAKKVNLDDRVSGNPANIKWLVNGVEKNSFLPIEESSPIKIEYEIEPSSGLCSIMGQQTIEIEENVVSETEKTVLVLSSDTVLPLNNYRYHLITPSSLNLTANHSNDVLSLQVANINSFEQVNLIELEGNTCLVNETINLYFEDPLIAYAGPDINIGSSNSGNLDAPFLVYGTGAWAINSSNQEITLDDVNIENSGFKVANPGKTTLIWTVMTPGGQTASDQMSVSSEQMTIRLPEAISPNDDGLNDEYRIEGLSGDEIVKLEVLNRWGQKLYSSDDYLKDNPWMGLDDFGNLLPEDTYMVNVTINNEKQLVAVLIKR